MVIFFNMLTLIFFWNLWCHLELIKFPFIYRNLILGCIFTLIILEMTLCKDSSPCDSWPCFHHSFQHCRGCPGMLLHKLLWLIPSFYGFNSAQRSFTLVSLQKLNMPCVTCGFIGIYFLLCASKKGDKGAVGDKGEGVFTDSWTPSWPLLGFSSHALWFC